MCEGGGGGNMLISNCFVQITYITQLCRLRGQLSPMNDAYITGNALPDILILHTPTRPTHTCSANHVIISFLFAFF